MYFKHCLRSVIVSYLRLSTWVWVINFYVSSKLLLKSITPILRYYNLYDDFFVSFPLFNDNSNFFPICFFLFSPLLIRFESILKFEKSFIKIFRYYFEKIGIVNLKVLRSAKIVPNSVIIGALVLGVEKWTVTHQY